VGDLFVHKRMKECCRKTLGQLDEKKKDARVLTGLFAVGSLLTWLGENPIHIATQTVANEIGTKGSSVGDPKGMAKDIDTILRATCRKLCELHHLEHAERGENKEAKFWKVMADSF
jgi:hypothetical protein